MRNAVNDGREIISVHYACESLTDATDHPPTVSCIAVASLNNGTREAFSLADLPVETDAVGREISLLERFYDYLSENRESIIVHWNMNSSIFGFAAPAKRYCFIASKEHPPYRPSDHLLYDIDDIVAEMYGDQYVRHPKFYNLASLNEVGLYSFLPGKEEANRFKSGDFGAINSSTTTKARANLDILRALLAGQLRTQRSSGSVRFAGQQIDAVDTILTIGQRMRDVERELSRRHGGRPTITVADEYDAQDLLKGLFALFFEDVRPETWTPNVAGGAARIDFLLPSFELAVEIKRARPSMTARSLGDELIVDRDRYKTEQRAKHLICLVFDYDGILPGPRGLEADLSRESTVEGLAVTVRIFDR
ncbi:hypothetical protein [Solwaraspora sp. WMMA2065]|uniref:PD-(D/E)XK nuclease domain-containing protein n=1 Tax=Solwaraspora sp. WMMA2065 TaxID=3015166 RepID=UPI00259B5F8B|nr:hypothetical protein [Solwaraspora sp. WMMA2065]WJK33982.1 hypothetical protein O7610_25605 [Solwaraspora sp. WMMA2065]